MNTKIWIRIAVSVGLLGWLLTGVDLGLLRTYLAGIPAVDVFLIICLYAAAWLVNTAKWHRLLPTQPFYRLFALNVIGQFYALVLPGQIAAEVVKSWKLIGRNGRAAKAVASVLMDRLTGVMSLLWIGISGAALTSTAAGSEFVVIFGILIGCFGLAGFLTTLNSFRSWSRKALAAMAMRIPRTAGAVDTLVGCIDAWSEYRRMPLRLLLALLLGLVFQLLAVAILHRLSLCFDMQVAFVDWCWIFSAVSLLLLLPITVGGIGLREGGFVALLATLGVPQEKALACSISLFGLQLLIAAAGAFLDLKLTVGERSLDSNTGHRPDNKVRRR